MTKSTTHKTTTSKKSPLRSKAVQRSKAKNRRTPKVGCPIVGIGASAGGLEAVTELLKALPPKPALAFVLVLHLDPTHESAMASLLSRATAMPVTEAKNNIPIEPGHVYVIPPNKSMRLAAGRLRLTPRGGKDPHAPIDSFLKSLAEEEGSRAIGVVLSGSGGSDGTEGLLAVKMADGITFAQDEQSAKYPHMPAAAVAAGCVDFVLRPQKMATELMRLAAISFGRSRPAEESGAEPPAEENAFELILGALRQHAGVDFSQYKHGTLRRRAQRRAMLHKLESLGEYAAYLKRHPEEVRELFGDILIHVTSFFRDAPVFETLKRKVFPRLVKKRAVDDTIRIWVPGCSTGEEVYSLAMLLIEYFSERREHFPVQIFGTDIDDSALERARAGVFPENIQRDVSVERLRRFFVKADRGFRINKAVREMCIFARQNVTSDPPFSNLDLISCRNVLIYLGASLQRKIMPLFHYALKPSGYLLLGAAETIGSHAEYFSLVEKKAKVYTKKVARNRLAMSFVHPPPEPRAPSTPLRGSAYSSARAQLVEIQKHADRLVLTQHGPAGVIVNGQLEVLQFRGRTGTYLEHPHGEATLDLLKMARDGLTAGLRPLVSRAIKQNVPVRGEGLQFKSNGTSMAANVEVVPFQLPEGRERFFLVLFTPCSAPPRKRVAPRKGGVSAERSEIATLTEELEMTRQSLQATIEEQEATNEELRSANEEIMSSNEELQSTNEELETAKEELQSTNEELTTLNDELESQNIELEHVNNDLHNLLASVNIPIVMVGPDLRIRRYTAIAEKLLNLIPTDIGRPLIDINLKVAVPALDHMIRQVIDSLQTSELDVRDNEGHWWSLRIRPYKTTDHKIDGAVVVLVDIDLLKRAMERVGEQRAFAEAIVNTVREPLLVLDERFVVQSANSSFYRIFRTGSDVTLQRSIYELGSGQWNIPKLRTLLEDVLPHNSSFHDFEIEHTFPELGRKTMLLNARRLQDESRLILLAIEEVKDADHA